MPPGSEGNELVGEESFAYDSEFSFTWRSIASFFLAAAAMLCGISDEIDPRTSLNVLAFVLVSSLLMAWKSPATEKLTRFALSFLSCAILKDFLIRPVSLWDVALSFALSVLVFLGLLRAQGISRISIEKDHPLTIFMIVLAAFALFSTDKDFGIGFTLAG